MQIRQFFDAESSTYTYLLAKNGEALLIDPVRRHLDAYLQLLRELNWQLHVAVDTHTHADHFSALGDLRAATGCLTMMGEQTAADCVSGRFSDGQLLPMSTFHLRALYTPGHTNESYCLVLEEAHGPSAVFTGDTLLIRGTGRTDFQNGDARAAYYSLFDKLLTLPDDTKVYPGHDYKGWTVSSIGEERAHNPRLQVQSVDEYVAIMAALKLPNPALMDEAVPANLRCGRA